MFTFLGKNGKVPFLGNNGYFRIKQIIAYRLLGIANVRKTWHLSRLKSGINPQLGIVNQLRHLTGEAEAQVIDVDDKKKRLRNWPLGNTSVNSGSVRGHAVNSDPLPPSCQLVLNPGIKIILAIKGENLPHKSFVKDLIESLVEI